MKTLSETGPDPFGTVMGGNRGTGQEPLKAVKPRPDMQGMSLQEWAASLDEERTPPKSATLHVVMLDCDNNPVDEETFNCDGKSLDELRRVVGDFIIMMASSGIHTTVHVYVEFND